MVIIIGVTDIKCFVLEMVKTNMKLRFSFCPIPSTTFLCLGSDTDACINASLDEHIFDKKTSYSVLEFIGL